MTRCSCAWTPRCAPRFAVLLALLAGAPAQAHTIVGDRVFPATLTIDDPGVNDELALPAFSYLTGSNFDGTPGPISYSLGWEYSKTLTPSLAFSLGSAFNWQRRPSAQGWSNLETQLKYVFWEDAKSESIIAGALSEDWASTGSPQSASLPSDPFTTLTAKLYAGKGFGDASLDWARPFAVTGEVDYAAPTRAANGDGSLNPSALTYGATLQYSLLYRNSHVEEVPEAFRKLIPAFEAYFTTPVANVAPTAPGNFPAHTTTGVFGPSLYYVGAYFEVGVMAQIPVNRASGSHVGALAVLDFFLDDIFPDTLGKPLFAAAAGAHY